MISYKFVPVLVLKYAPSQGCDVNWHHSRFAPTASWLYHLNFWIAYLELFEVKKNKRISRLADPSVSTRYTTLQKTFSYSLTINFRGEIRHFGFENQEKISYVLCSNDKISIAWYVDSCFFYCRKKVLCVWVFLQKKKKKKQGNNDLMYKDKNGSNHFSNATLTSCICVRKSLIPPSNNSTIHYTVGNWQGYTWQ